MGTVYGQTHTYINACILVVHNARQVVMCTCVYCRSAKIIMVVRPLGTKQRENRTSSLSLPNDN